MKFVTSISYNNTNVPVDYIYVESPEIAKQVYVINTIKRSSPCDIATGVCHCTLNLSDIH